jgi:RNA polymerase sigma-70 factor (ECF subfamily)
VVRGREAARPRALGHPDDALVRSARAGDKEAFGELTRRYWNVAAAAALVETGDYHVAEDVAQRAFLTSYRKLRQLRRPERFASWLLRIVHRLARRARKRGTRSASWTPDQASDPGASRTEGTGHLPDVGLPGPAAQALRQEERDRILAAVQRLKARDRTVVLLRYFEELSFETISRMTGHSEGALRVRLHRALRRLRRDLAEYFGDEGLKR